jgi:phage terminase large subunit
VWFVQTVGLEYRVIDYMSDSQRAFNHYLAELQSRGYIYGRLFLPHDAQAKQLGSGKSIEEIARAAGWRVHIVPKLSIEDGINAARTVFSNVWIDAEKCSDGLQSLRHYRYEVDEDSGGFKRRPLHDEASHGSDAWRYMAVSLKPKAAVGVDRYSRSYKPRRSGGGHMAA